MGVAEDFAPSFTQKPQLRQEDDGNRLIFECQLLSAPKPDIQWFRSDTLLSEDNRTNFKIQSIGTNKFLVVLELDDVIETDAGLYKVKAKNKMGEVSASINLNFSRKCICFSSCVDVTNTEHLLPRYLSQKYRTYDAPNPLFTSFLETAVPSVFTICFSFPAMDEPKEK